MSTARCQLHGAGRDALTAAAHARLLAAKQHLDSRSSVRRHRRLEPASPTHPSRLEYTPPLLALSGAATRTAARTRVAAAAQRRAARGEAGLGSTAHSARRSRRGTVLPPCCTALHRASPASHAPWPFLKPLIPSPLSAASQYVDPLRNACVSCDDVQWSPTLPALLAMLALALAARRLVASSPPVARVANRAVRRVPLWMRPGLPHWMGTFQSVVYAKIVWYARTTPLTPGPNPEIIWSARSLHARPHAPLHTPPHTHPRPHLFRPASSHAPHSQDVHSDREHFRRGLPRERAT